MFVWLQRSWKTTLSLMLALSVVTLTAFASLMPSGVTQGVDVKVTLDNNNVDAGFATPGFDGRNLEQNETTVAISPLDPNIVAVANNDFRRVFAPDDFFTWLGLNVSTDGGATFHNTFPPGFLTDTSAAGLASPLKGYNSASDPVVRFDAAGNLYLAGIAFSNPFVDQPGGIDNVAFLVKYDYTPGTPAGVSTPNAAGNPPNFTYAFTTIVDRASSFSRSGGFGNGKFDDFPWMTIDTNSSSPGLGNIYFTIARLTGNTLRAVFSRSTDGGRTFSEPIVISQRDGPAGNNAASHGIAVGTDGRVYVAYVAQEPKGGLETQKVVRSDDFGWHFGKPVTAAIFSPVNGFEDGVAFRTGPLVSFAADDTNPGVLYIAYPAYAGSPVNTDIFVVRSTDGGQTWGAPVRVNDDATAKHQFMPSIAVSNGALHVAWYDLRDSPNPDDPALTNDVLNVYYASSNTTGVPYPAFSHNVKVTDVGFQPNCRLHIFFGTEAFIGDYIELAARFDGANHIVHVAWADNRDIPADKCDLDSAPGPFGDDFTGRNNQNVYADRLIVTP
jgi:hypothetical protein